MNGSWFRKIIKNQIEVDDVSKIEENGISKEAVELIKEFGEEASIVGDNLLNQ